jgi:hypothetical protein
VLNEISLPFVEKYESVNWIPNFKLGFHYCRLSFIGIVQACNSKLQYWRSVCKSRGLR